MKITVKDIALRAGVSDGSVSNALNNRKGISKEKREHIIRIAREMGYYKNSSNENKVIRLLIVKKEANVIDDTPFFSELIRGIELECTLEGYTLIINHINSDIFKESQIEEIIKADQASGILLLATEMDAEDLVYFENICIPLVILDAAFTNMLFDYIAINNTDASYKIVEHLINYGHTNIGIINSSHQINNFRERKIGYAQALNDYNLPVIPENEAIVEPNPEGAYIDMKAYINSFLKELDISHFPTAFFAVNDNIAFGAIKAFNELNHPISICGFDDLPISDLISPALTTVHVDKLYLGKSAVSRLIQKINKQDANTQKILVASKVIVRESVEYITK